MTSSVSSASLLELDHASVKRGDRVVLDDVSLRVNLGEHTAVLGPNGCGKSTFVKLITRELYPLARPGMASVRLFGEARWDVTELRSRLGLVSADLHRDLATVAAMTALDAVVCGYFASQRLPAHRDVEPWMHVAALDALQRVDAADLASRRVAALSTGELRRAVIARALVHKPQALLLDEPTTGLDVVARSRFLHMLSALARAGTSLLLVTHHVEEIVPEIGRVLLLSEGRVIADGTPAQVLTDTLLSQAYAAPLRVRRLASGYAIEPA